ncbi:MAG: HAMP domain-containing protein [Phycisphaerales bacterium]|nr:MAG: HAMP domain-containing protein [Phycisphaerales bacterium]
MPFSLISSGSQCRLALALKSIGEKTQSARKIVWTIAIIALVASVFFALGLARLWMLPIRRITAIAGRISSGDLSARARIRGSDEVAGLARSLNEMRDHLSRQLATIGGQRRTLETLLNQLQEGIIVAGPDGKIVLANPAAARFVDADGARRPSPASWVGRLVEQCVPQHDLQRLLLPSKSAEVSTEDVSAKGSTSIPCAPGERPPGEFRVELPSASGPIVVLASASDITLPGMATGESEPESDVKPRIGRILALTDITEIARTIQVKTDFAANASYELRTPLSAIRGAIETVLDIDLSKDAASAKRFLGVIDRHSARLEALVADLLALSRLESPVSEFRPVSVDWARFGGELRAKWNDAVEKRQLHLEWIAPAELREVTADAQLIRLVLDDLVDNTIKFTAAGGRIIVNSRREGGDLFIEVSDDGCGIAVEDQQRVFERFYQVAQARSGTGSGQPESRGTGLGLSIVRHAVAAMKGTARLTSELNVGTRVTVTVPQSGL